MIGVKLGKWKRRACLGRYVVGLIIVLELVSWLILGFLVSPMRMERFNDIFLKEPTEYRMLPHPYLDYVTPRYVAEQEGYLSHIGENRTNMIYVVALGGSTTEGGHPAYIGQYLDRRLESANSPLRTVVFNFGMGGWNSFNSLQNYVYLVRYLHPDIVVTHHNINDIKGDSDRRLFQQSVLHYPQISRWERALVGNSRTYKLLKFAYLISYNPVRYGTKTLYTDDPALPTDARISSYLNENVPMANPVDFFTMDFIGLGHQRQELTWGFLLTETYESFIRYTRADNSTLIMTTQYLNWSKIAQFNGVENMEEPKRLSRDINNLLRNLSRQYQVPLVDLDAEMEHFDYSLKDDGTHFTEEGIKLKGELIGEAIFEILKEQYGLDDNS